MRATHRSACLVPPNQLATNRTQSRTNPARRTPSIHFEPRGVVAELLLSCLSPQRGQLADVQVVIHHGGNIRGTALSQPIPAPEPTVVIPQCCDKATHAVLEEPARAPVLTHKEQVTQSPESVNHSIQNVPERQSDVLFVPRRAD